MSDSCTKLSHCEGLLKADVNVIYSDDVANKLFKPKNTPISEPIKNKTIFKYKRSSLADSQAPPNEYNASNFYSKRSSISTLYNETKSFKQKTKSRVDSSSACKSQKSIFSGPTSPKSKTYLANLYRN